MQYAVWVAVLLPLLGALLSFVAETPRRAAQVCMTLMAGSLLAGLVLLGYRFAHHTQSGIPNLSRLTFFSVSTSATETSIFGSSLTAEVGVLYDNLSASFLPLVAFLFLAVQGLGTAMLRGDPGYRRFFWVTSALASAVLGMIASPGLFQEWMALGVMSVLTLVLTLHRWHREETVAPSRRAFLTLLGADFTMLMGLAYLVWQVGAKAVATAVPAGLSATPVDDLQVLGPIWQQMAQGHVAHHGYQGLVVMCLLFGVAALIRSAQLPFTGWFSALREAPLPVLAALAVSLLAGVILVARVYTLLLVTLHALSVLTLVAATGAVGLALASLMARDIYRLALLSTAAQVALAITALGAGGYSAGLLIAFVTAPLGLLLFAVAGSVARSYRTRDIGLMGGAWGRMRRTSLGLGVWAVLTAGLDLVGYDAVSTLFLNRLPNAGHLAAWVRDLAAALVIVALVLTTLYAARLLVRVCAGQPVPRRGGVVERIAEAEPRLRSVQAWCAAAAAVAVVTGLPGIQGFGTGKSRVPGLTFSHWVFYGGIKQKLPFDPLALAVALVVLAGGLAVGILAARVDWGRVRARARIPALGAAPWAKRLPGLVPQIAARAGMALAARTVATDRLVIEPLYDAAGEGMESAAWALGRAPGRRMRLGLLAALAVVLLLVGLSVLAAGGRLPVHTT